MTLLDEKINACREAMQKAIKRAEEIQEIKRMLEEEIKDDHIRFNTDPFYQENIFEELL